MATALIAVTAGKSKRLWDRDMQLEMEYIGE